MKTLIILLMAATCYGSTAWENSLADAIFKAEGGHKTKHEYGILAHYQHTTPRQACLNTISHSRKRWEAAGKPCNFVEYLSRSYCPIGALNDPTGLNYNWVKNVSYFMTHSNQPLNPL